MYVQPVMDSEINHSCVRPRIGCLECITKNSTPSSEDFCAGA